MVVVVIVAVVLVVVVVVVVMVVVVVVVVMVVVVVVRGRAWRWGYPNGGGGRNWVVLRASPKFAAIRKEITQYNNFNPWRHVRKQDYRNQDVAANARNNRKQLQRRVGR